MDSNELLADIISSVAWPSAVLISILILKSEIRGVFSKMRALRYKDFAAEFEIETRKTLEGLRESIRPELLKLPTTPPEPTAEAILQTFFFKSPKDALLLSYESLEMAMRSYARKNNVDLPDHAPFAEVLNAVRKVPPRGPIMAIFVESMQELRNRLVHHSDSELRKQLALEFVAIAVALKAIFESPNDWTSNG